jgi:L-ascorbate metabolism protein UlaG (beta-lactamase superfamily)
MLFKHLSCNFVTRNEFIFQPKNYNMQFTFYGHACFMIEVQVKKKLFDPFITYNELAKNISIDSIKADYIFLSHGQADHIADFITIANNTGAKVVAVFEVHEWLNKNGVTNTHPMNTGGKWQFEFGTVKCVVAQHSSALPDGSYGGNPIGFVFTTPEGNFYYSGDTALTLDMQLIPGWANSNYAILPIGDNFTMDVQDAIKAADLVKCNQIIGVHYDTFGYIKIDKAAAKQAFANAGKTLHLPAIGVTITL